MVRIRTAKALLAWQASDTPTQGDTTTTIARICVCCECKYRICTIVDDQSIM